MTSPAIPADGWVRYPHRPYDLTTGGALISGTAPFALIRASAPDARAAGGMPNEVRAHAVLDTGAATTMVPVWALRDMGVELDEGTKTKVAGATGWAEAYRARVDLELFYGSEWIGLGSVTVLSPDTEWSRHRRHNLPFLLGRDGFFDKFHMLFDQARGDTWLRRIGG